MCSAKGSNFFLFEGKSLNDNFGIGRITLQNKLKALSDSVNDTYTLELYSKLFAAANGYKAIGEMNLNYLFNSEKVLEQMAKYTPEAKLIVILRNPIERSYAAYLELSKVGVETTVSFEKAFSESQFRDNYTQFYSNGLRKFLKSVDNERISIFLFDHLKKDPLAFMREVYSFLGVNDNFIPKVAKKYNVSYYPRTLWIKKIFGLYSDKRQKKATNPPLAFLKKLIPLQGQLWCYRNILLPLDKRFNSSSSPPLTLEMRIRLLDFFREDIFQVQDLIQENLSSWLQVEPKNKNDKSHADNAPIFVRK